MHVKKINKLTLIFHEFFFFVVFLDIAKDRLFSSTDS